MRSVVIAMILSMMLLIGCSLQPPLTNAGKVDLCFPQATEVVKRELKTIQDNEEVKKYFNELADFKELFKKCQ